MGADKERNNMKTKSKIILLAVAIATLLSCTVLQSGAAENIDTAYTVPEDDLAESLTEESGALPESEDLITALFADLKEYSPVIFSALAALGSLLLAFCYRRGLMPILKDAIGGIAGAVSTLGERVAERDKEKAASDRATEDRLAALEEGLCRTGELAARLAEAKRGEESIRAAINAEVELLLELFMQSSLPEYKKEAIERRISAIKSGIGEEAAELEA